MDPHAADVGDLGHSADGAIDPECAVDRDGDGFRFGPGCPAAVLDCDDNDAAVYPGADPVCNGRDNNCDGDVDGDGCVCTDGLMSECGFSIGECEKGTRVCELGAWSECTGGVPAAEEQCNGLDDDCNGTVDEGCPCEPGGTQRCGVDEGACTAGTQQCVDGAWSLCEGAAGPSEELCNGVDDDCDGIADNAPTDVGAPCTSGEPGICAGGVEACRGGRIVCEAGAGRGELCNGIDDDCDGATDEDLTQGCGSTCGAGIQTCSNGAWGVCLPSNPTAELCNGMDDDCDGMIDETFPEDGASCIATGEVGVCAAGESRCQGGMVRCVSVATPSAEICDGLDNDCDGLVDEDANDLVLAEHCGGACPAGAVRLCLGGVWSACDVRDVELCNMADDNCDSAVDNLSACYAACENGQVAVGTRDCPSNNCKLPKEICGDGIDNDCDGEIDRNCDNSLTDMVYIPGGTFRMGSAASVGDAADDEKPIHTVELAAFYIDKYEVQRGQYGDCVIAGQCSTLAFGCPLQLAERSSPVTCVTWDQAQSYCGWKGKRLPTEAEWEKSARGPFKREVLWPWGNTADASRAQMDCSGSLNQCVVSVSSMPNGASYYGLHHMAGNAAEWVADFYSDSFYTSAYTVQPYNGMNSGNGHVLRGGGWRQELQFGRVSNRATAGSLDDVQRGFRCAK